MKKWKQSFKESFFCLEKDNFQIDISMNLKYKNIPKSIFKYCSFDNNNLNIKNLNNNEVWLSNPSTFNDPYDCLFTGNDISKIVKELNNSDIDKYLLEFQDNITSDEKQEIKSSKTPYDELQKVLISKELLSKENFDFFKEDMCRIISDDLELLNSNIKNTYKISCFTELNKSMLMWSHYSHNHTGFCIEYSKDIKSNFFKYLFPINYTDKLFNITEYYNYPSADRNINYLLQGITTKSKEWTYEREWRLIQRGELSGGIKFPMPMPKAIYLGAKISSENLRNMKYIAKKKNIELYKMELDKLEYKLVPKKVHI